MAISYKDPCPPSDPAKTGVYTQPLLNEEPLELLQYPNYCTCCDTSIPFDVVLCDDCKMLDDALDYLELSDNPNKGDGLVPHLRRRNSDPGTSQLAAMVLSNNPPPLTNATHASEMHDAVSLVTSGDMLPELQKWKAELSQSIDNQTTWTEAKRRSVFFRYALIAMTLYSLVGPAEARSEDDEGTPERIIAVMHAFGWALFPFVLVWSLWSITTSFTTTVSALLKLTNKIGVNMAKYTKYAFIVQSITAGCTVFTGLLQCFISWKGLNPMAYLRPEAITCRKTTNKIGVVLTMLLACLMFIVGPLWGCSKAFKKFEPMMRMLERLPYVTWFIEWAGNFLNGDASLDDVPEFAADIKKTEPKRESYPWHTPERAAELAAENEKLDKHDVETCSDKGKCGLGKCLCKCHVEEEYELFRDFDLKARCDNKDIQAQRGGLGSVERTPYQELVDVAHQIMKEPADERIKRWKRYYCQAKRADPERAKTIVEKFIFRYPWMNFLAEESIEEDVAASSEVREYDDVMTDILLLTHYMCVDHDKDLPSVPTTEHPLKSESLDDHLEKVAQDVYGKYGGLPFLRFYDPWFKTTTEINAPCRWPRTFKEVCVDSFWRTLGFGEDTAKMCAAHVKKHQRKYAVGATAGLALLGALAYFLRSPSDEPIWEDEAQKGKTKSRRAKFVPGANRASARDRQQRPWNAASSGSEDEVAATDADDSLSRFDERFYYGNDTGDEVGFSHEALSEKDKLLEVLLSPAELSNIKALRKLRPTPPPYKRTYKPEQYAARDQHAANIRAAYKPERKTSDIRSFFKPVSKDSIANGPEHTVNLRSAHAVNKQMPPGQQVKDVAAAQSAAPLKKKTMQSEALLGKEKIDFTQHCAKVYQFHLDDEFVSSATVVSDKIVFPLHALKNREDASPSIHNFSASAELKKKYVEIAPDLGIIPHYGGVKTEKGWRMRAPENEIVFVLGFNKQDQTEPTAGIGHCTKDGVYNAQTLPGDCGGPVIAAKDGCLVGFHIAGSEFMNKFIPMTEQIATKLKTSTQVIESSLFH